MFVVYAVYECFVVQKKTISAKKTTNPKNQKKKKKSKLCGRWILIPIKI